MFLQDMNNKAFDEIKSGNAFFDGFIILAPGVMESNYS